MPIYEFKCKECNNVFEAFFRSTQEKLALSCPVCKSKKVDKLMSVFGGKISNASLSCSTSSGST